MSTYASHPHHRAARHQGGLFEPFTREKAFSDFAGRFSRYHASLKCELFPRDFMEYNERLNALGWFYVLPEGADPDKLPGYNIVNFTGGLFAVAPCLDGDPDHAADRLKTREELMAWVNESTRFRLYENGNSKRERYPLFHIVSPGRMIESGLSIEDLYIPIEEK